MKKTKQISQLILSLILLTSCRTLINNEEPSINSEENIDENYNSKKERMEIKFSCGDDGISKYLDDGWIIIKENLKKNLHLEIILTKDCDMEKDKGCKLTKPDKVGEENLFIRKTTLIVTRNQNI